MTPFAASGCISSETCVRTVRSVRRARPDTLEVAGQQALERPLPFAHAAEVPTAGPRVHTQLLPADPEHPVQLVRAEGRQEPLRRHQRPARGAQRSQRLAPYEVSVARIDDPRVLQYQASLAEQPPVGRVFAGRHDPSGHALLEGSAEPQRPVTPPSGHARGAEQALPGGVESEERN